MLRSPLFDLDPATDERVVHGSGDRLLAIFDGAGSWEYGSTAAEWTRRRALPLLAGGTDCSAGELVHRLATLGSPLHEHFRDCGFDITFDLFVVRVVGRVADFISLGSYGCRLVRSGETYVLLEATMLVDKLIAEGKLDVVGAQVFPHHGVCLGPYFGDSAVTDYSQVLVPLELELEQGDRLLIAPERVLREASSHASLASLRCASELRAHGGPGGVVVVVNA